MTSQSVASQGRGLNIAVWVASGLMAALYLMTGIMKLTSQAAAVEGFHKYGYSDEFRMFIGACEFLGAIAFLIPRLAFWSACGLLVIMVGAVQAHMTHDEASHVPPVVIIMGVLAFIAWARRGRAFLLS